MKYRKMGSLNWEVSALGFGAMRLPVDKNNKIVEKEAIEMIHYAIDHGVNYVDTAYSYHNGESEVLVGKALKNGYREKVHLTTKLPIWLVKSRDDFDTLLNEQSERLQTKPDIYLFHGLNKDRFEKVKALNLIEKMQEVKRNGKIKYFGFSFHDSYDVFKEIIDFYDWDCCQIQHNYIDINYQAGTKGLHYAGKKGIAVIIMEPIRGGKLAIPEDKLGTKPEIKKVLDKSKIKRSMPDWALTFLWNQPEVSVVLSGMSSIQHVIENVESADKSGINILIKDELKTISQLRDAFNKYTIVPCTSCGYCMPCPNGVSIPFILLLLNDLYYWQERGRNRIAFFYDRMVKTPEEIEKMRLENEEFEGAACLCTQCGECLEKCPQGIDIPAMMQKIDDIFGKGKKCSEVFN